MSEVNLEAGGTSSPDVPVFSTAFSFLEGQVESLEEEVECLLKRLAPLMRASAETKDPLTSPDKPTPDTRSQIVIRLYAAKGRVARVNLVLRRILKDLEI